MTKLTFLLTAFIVVMFSSQSFAVPHVTKFSGKPSHLGSAKANAAKSASQASRSSNASHMRASPHR